MLRYDDPPTFLVLQLSGNDIGQFKLGDLRIKLKSIILWLKTVLPGTIITLSPLLARLAWRFSPDLKAMEKSHYRLNNAIRAFVLGFWGRYIHYLDLRKNILRYYPLMEFTSRNWEQIF